MDEINALFERAAERGVVRGAGAVWDGAVAALEGGRSTSDVERDVVPLTDESAVVGPEHIVNIARSARRWLAIAAALVVLCGAGVLKLAVVRREANHATVSKGATGTWPMVLAPGLVPFYEAGAGLPADLGDAHDEDGLTSLRCMRWTLAGTSVLCSALDDPGPDGILPAVSHRSADGRRSVDIFLRHRPIDDAAQYAFELSQGKDVGYDQTPLSQTPIKVRGTSGWLAEPGNDVRRVVWTEPTGTPIALEGHGLTVDELTAIAAGLRPGDLGDRAVPLVFADSGRQPDGRRAMASGFIRDGTACLLLEPEHVCVARPAEQPLLLSSAIGGAIAGMTDGQAVAVQSTDGTSRHVTRSYPSLGFTAFAFVDDAMTSVDVVDAVGRSLGNEGSSPMSIARGRSPSTSATAPPDVSTTVPG